MLAVVNRFVGMVPPLVWAGLCASLFVMFLFNSWRLDSANKALGAASVAVDRSAEVNKHNGTTIVSLKNANAACLQGRAVDTAQFNAANLDWQVQKERLVATAKEVRIHEIEVFKDPTCADLAQLDVGANCPEFAKRLRIRTGSLNRIRNGGSISTRKDPDT